ncbi:hypothetical protein [Promicromonospora panici]|uniref:hypothetical protein n=1 Tax=Promicromonospora panici TaxID=2219658 RepID=UPI00101C8EF1|nr:hypothetical protein [Promicromonospora panici]
MPSPVSPDAGVPEHQPDPRRQTGRPRTGGQPRQTPNAPPQNGGRPQSGQFPSSQFQSGRFPAGGQQQQPGQQRSGQFPSGQFQSGQFQSGQFPTRSGATPTAPGPGRPPTNPADGGDGRDGSGRGKNSGRRDWIWSIVAFLVAAAVIAAVGFHFFGPDTSEEPGATWAVDSCAGPDPSAEDIDAATDTYRPLSCDDPEATVTVLDIQDAVSVAQVHCPAGTDIVFQKSGQAGGDTQAVCARNLSDDHPGDPGMGGGQLVTGDCVNGDGGEVTCSEDGARKVTGLMVGGAECPDGTVDQLELGFDAARSYETICLGD